MFACILPIVVIACCMCLLFFQCIVSTSLASPEPALTIPPESPELEFLGPEMANLQKLLATMTTGKKIFLIVITSKCHVQIRS